MSRKLRQEKLKRHDKVHPTRTKIRTDWSIINVSALNETTMDRIYTFLPSAPLTIIYILPFCIYYCLDQLYITLCNSRSNINPIPILLTPIGPVSDRHLGHRPLLIDDWIWCGLAPNSIVDDRWSMI